MDEFKVPYLPETVNKSIRFPVDVVESVEKAIQGKSTTFSAFVIAATRLALKKLAEQENRSKQTKRTKKE